MARNLILKYRSVLEDKNYVASGQANNYWFNFYSGKLLTNYQNRYGEDFNLIIYGSDNDEKDFYIIPFSYVKNIFVKSNWDEGVARRKERWQGYITNHILNIKGHKIDVKEYYANLNLLGKYINIKETENHQPSTENSQGGIGLAGHEESHPDRRTIEVSRIDRDTKLIKELKKLYENRCQICGKLIRLKDQDYSEAHHLKPLGSPHEGPDDKANILILCPNHHVEFNYGSMAIDPKTLKLTHIDCGDEINGKDLISHKHGLGEEYLRYHYEKIFAL